MDDATKAQTIQLLQGLTSTDKATREQATKLYDQAKESQAQSLVVGFVGVLGSQGSVEDKERTSAAIFLRQLVNKDNPQSFCWPKVPNQAQQEVAGELLRRFESETVASVQKKVGDVISELAEHACDSGDPRSWLVQGGANGWPQLLPVVFKMAHPGTAPNAGACIEGITLMKKLVCTCGSEMVSAQAEIGALLQGALGHAEIKIRFAALLLICEMVQRLKKKEWAPLMSTAPVLTQVLQQLAQATPIMEEELNEGIQELMEVAAIEPDFFKQQLSSNLQPATFFASLVKTKEGLEESLRQVALEWLVSYLEKKPKWIGKSLQAYPKMVVECCMALMLEIDDGEAELKAWAERMDDEEGEEDCDELFHTGEQSIDRVAEALGMDVISQALFALIAQLVGQNTWQATHAALAAIKQTVEYVENNDHTNEMAKLLLQHVDNPHPRVRYTALHAIGQLANDQAPTFQESWHQTVMPVLLNKMDDSVNRVAAMAMSAFVSFGEELDNALMMTYANPFMEKLVARLKTTSHRGVREESITAIAVIAGVMEKDFARYYDATMPMLKEIVMHAKGEKESRLRGKSFECMSLLGIAVGKEKFLPDAQGAISEMLNTNLEADDVQREYIKEASERICHCLKRDFAPFLTVLLPGILKSLKLEDQGASADGDDDAVEISNAEGKTVKVKSSQFEELMQSIQLLYTFADEMEGAFFDYVQPTAEALLPLISMQNEALAYISDEAYAQALHTWALLIKCAKDGAKERNISSDVPTKLLQTFLVKTTQDMEDQKNDDPEALGAAASGIADCLKNVGEGCLSADEALKLVTKVFKLIDDSLARTQKHIQDSTKQDEGAPPELQNDEDDEEAKEDFLGLEENCRRNYEEALGAVMKVAPQHFATVLTDCGAKMTTWLSSKRTKVLALYFACDLLEHLKAASCPIWPAFMTVLFDALGDTDTDARTAAAYAINLASSIPAFAEAAPEAFKRLNVILTGPTPKKKDEKGRMAFENAVAAMLALARNCGAQCPPDVPAWKLVVSKLPIQEDQEEAKKVHKIIVDLVLEQNAGLLGAGGENLGPILSSLAEIYKQENICEEETDKKIKQIFKTINHDTLRSFAGKFNEKQQKKIERMLSENPAP